MQIALFERLPQSAEECLRAPLSASLQESAPPDLPQGAKSPKLTHLHNHLIRQFTFKNHILKVTKKECKDVPRQKCKFVPKPVCHYVPKEKCDYVPKEQCQLVPTQNCYAVPKQHCVDVPKEECHLVPREQCHKVPREHCETVARPHCEKVAHEVCHPVASQECRSVPGFKRRAFYINFLQSCVLKVFNWPWMLSWLFQHKSAIPTRGKCATRSTRSTARRCRTRSASWWWRRTVCKSVRTLTGARSVLTRRTPTTTRTKNNLTIA